MSDFEVPFLSIEGLSVAPSFTSASTSVRTPSPTPSSALSSNHGSKAKSTWAFARPPRPDEPTKSGKDRIFYCKLCQDYSCKSTTSARNHLWSKHQIQLDTAKPTEPTPCAPNKEAINKALVWLIIQHDMPFRAVQWPALHAFIEAISPSASKLVISSHTTVSRIIDSLWLEAVDNIQKRLQSSSSKIHFAADIWTSPNHLLFLGICVHFVDHETQQLTRILLGLRQVFTHRGDDQAAEIFSLFKSFGILPKIGYFMGDNHTANDTLCRALSSSLEAQGILWAPVQHRLRCNGHIINLAVQAFLFGNHKDIDQDVTTTTGIETDLESGSSSCLQGGGFLLDKLHNIAVHIRASPARSTEFKNLAGRSLPLDNDTRWNSWYLMVETALKIHEAIDVYTKRWQGDLREDYLSLEDWDSLREISKFLKLFYRATLETQGKRGTLDQVLWTMDIIVKHYERSFQLYEKQPPLRARVLRSWEVFDKYYAKTEEVPVYATALILHPARRLGYLKQNWKQQWYRSAMKGIRKLWESYRDLGILDFSLVELKTDDLDEFDVLAQENEVIGANGDEYEIYTRERPIAIQGSALDWWLAEERRKTWPRLSQLAIDVLSIPAMSDEPERVFSGARRTISWDRTQMGANKIEKTQCLKSWKKAGFITEGMDHLDDFMCMSG